tara:strand:- start:257 stop:1048 length:792 start_codon:yes stop_codon:yes gene_type:complete
MDLYNDYQAAIKPELQITNPLEWSFKRNDQYRAMLEHCSESQGTQYLIELKKKFSQLYTDHKELLIDLCNKNDLYGQTIKANISDFAFCSPSNLRYIFHSFLILNYIKENNLNDINFIEIGGGYGGLCFFVKNLASLLGIKICSYSLFDLQEAAQLQEKYLEALGVQDYYCFQFNNFKKKELKRLKTDSFLISNYAFSEIHESIQAQYREHIINPYTPWGFLTWNAIDVYDFVDNSKIKKEKEYPQTDGTWGKNYYVTFSPRS